MLAVVILGAHKIPNIRHAGSIQPTYLAARAIAVLLAAKIGDAEASRAASKSWNTVVVGRALQIGGRNTETGKATDKSVGAIVIATADPVVRDAKTRP